jgi:NhaP-type Na+/H+ or K+/H+ antiporter
MIVLSFQQEEKMETTDKTLSFLQGCIIFIIVLKCFGYLLIWALHEIEKEEKKS